MIRGAVCVIINKVIEGTFYYKSQAEKVVAEHKAEDLCLELERTFDTLPLVAYMETDRTDIYS